MTNNQEELVVSKTVRSDIFRSEVVKVLGAPQGVFYYARVILQGYVVEKSQQFFDQDEAEMEAESMREKIFREKFGTKK